MCVCFRIYRDAFKMTIILPPTPQNGLHIQSDWKKAREREREITRARVRQRKSERLYELCSF